MDTAYPEGAVSLVSLIDGTTSIYYSVGGGVIGGQAHESVAEAAKAFVRKATEYLAKSSPIDHDDLPPVGYTRFFILTDAGTRAAEAAEVDLGEGQHELSPLFYSGHEVITQLRLNSELS